MKRILFYCLFLVGFFFFSCKKDSVKMTPLTSLNVTNAVVGGAGVRLGSNATTVANNNYSQLALVAGENNLYLWPVGDSAHPYYNSPKFSSANGEIYSLFLTGTTAAPEGVIIKENIPYRTDSTAGVRFINLAPGSGSLTITRKQTPSVNEVTGLGYKQYTEFRTYQGKYNSADTFQVRDGANAVLTTFNFTTATQPRFANVTLVIRQNGTGVSVFRVNNDR